MKNKSIKEIAAKIVSFIFITFLIVSCYLIFSSKATGTAPQLGGYQFMTILTGSMYPTIKPGSLIITKEVNDPKALMKGDVVTFHSPRNNGELITHRIVEVKKENSTIYYKTKGDMNSTADARMITSIHVIGKYQNYSIPYVGYIVEMSKTKAGYVLFFLLPTLVLIITNRHSILSLFKRDGTNTGGVVHESHKLDN